MNTTTQAGILSASLFRQMFYLRMMQIEQKFFLKQGKTPSGVKNVLKRLSDQNARGLSDVKANLPQSGDIMARVLDCSEEKLQAMANIMERLAAMPEGDVLQIESQYVELIKISY